MITLERRIKQLEADVKYLVWRNEARVKRMEPRCWGISSDAIIRFAYGGEPPGVNEAPWDRSDLDACEVAVTKLPRHRKTAAVKRALDVARLEIENRVKRGDIR